jgi:NADH-ubiquinone oxidoreductase chain 5
LTKRAQFPFSAWLPAAIAAPTPVSSLVHSRTLVTAGFYIIFRFSNFNSIFYISIILILFSYITILYSGINGLLELDFKKIIALSTLRQISLIFIRLRIEIKIISFFHLFTHAFFKSLLFIRVGCIIHLFFNNQDLRNYNIIFLNLLKLSLLFSIFSLIGIFFSSGFFRKDFILEKILLKKGSIFFIWVFFFIIFLTMFYSIRLLLTSFFLKINQKMLYFTIRISIIKRIFFLRFTSIIIGSILN